jgi:phosphohistidine swiveling domain-containing protein
MEMDALVVSLDELARAPRPVALVGSKAANLARLVAAGLPVPAGWVLTTPAHALPEAGRAQAVAALAAQIAAAGLQRLAVRSSSTIEDRPGAAAPGIFASRVGVTASDLDAAVRAVWASAEAPLVRAYAEARGIADVDMAVIVQPVIAGERAGVAYTRLPGQPAADELLIETYERAGAPAAALRLPRSGATQPGIGLDRPRLDALVRAVLAAEVAIGAAEGADVEWVIAGEQVWLVQARPVVHPLAAPAPAFPAALLAFSRAEPEIVWRWDVAHNPDPLSPAQAGLVERMDAARVIPDRMRVVGGYLYYGKARTRAPALPDGWPISDAAGDSAGNQAGDPAGNSAGDPAATLRQRFEAVWRPAMEVALAAAEAAEAPLDQVLDAYGRFYAVYAGELTSWLAAARRALPAFLAQHLPDGDAEELAGMLLVDASDARLETWIGRVARGTAAFDELIALAGPMAPAWDVAVPTFAERPALLHRAVAAAAAQPPRAGDPAEQARARVHARLAPAQREPFERCLALARAARDLGERDDQLFARAQAAVRHALLRLARQWQWPVPDDVFFVPLDRLLAWQTPAQTAAEPPLPAVRRLAQAGRAARERQRAWAMPLAFAAGEPLPGASAPHPGADAWHGRGTGGRARGVVVRVADLGDLTAREEALPEHAILVVPTLTPAMAVLLHGVSAVVAEHGGLLDHGAAMARELGLPCVVACAGAWSQLDAGDTLLVDGDAGLVLRLGQATRAPGADAPAASTPAASAPGASTPAADAPDT